jgi:hypothetical protein
MIGWLQSFVLNIVIIAGGNRPVSSDQLVVAIAIPYSLWSAMGPATVMVKSDQLSKL